MAVVKHKRRTAYSWFLEKALLPSAAKAVGRSFWRTYRQLEKSQWRSQESLNKLQTEKLKKLVKHAYETVPLYREIFDTAGIRPEDINSPSDLSKLPIVKKSDFRVDFPSRCTSNIIPKSNWLPDSTSGSTGSPFQFIRDAHFSDVTLANTFRCYTWTGVNLGEKMALLWGYHKAPIPARIHDFLLRRRFYSSFDVDSSFEKYYYDMIKYKPKLIEAYTASIVHYAELLKQSNLNGLTIPAAICSAETLYSHHRAIIEQQLGTKVYNRYGSREVGVVAQECSSHRGLHINSESYIVEIVRDKPEDEFGHIIVTNLENYTMPFIRYDTEDYGTSSSETCPCGRALPLLASVEGRISDFIELPNGNKLSFLFFNYFFEQYGSYLKQFQIIQDKRNHCKVLLVPTINYTPEKEKDIIEGLSEKLPGVSLTINKVDTIQLEPSGKMRPVKRMVFS